jgi:acetyltransferase
MAVTEREIVLKNGDLVRIRPIHPADEPQLAAFHRGLSDRSVYQRYFHMMQLEHRIRHERLARVCAADEAHESVLVMERADTERRGEVVGVARLTIIEGPAEGEFAVLVTDAAQGIGAGTALMRTLVEVARERRLACLRAEVLTDNVDMQRMCRGVGVALRPSREPGVLLAELDLTRGSASG